MSVSGDPALREFDRTRVGEALSRVGEALSRVGEAFSRVGEAFSRVSEAFSRVSEAFSRVSEAFSRVWGLLLLACGDLNWPRGDGSSASDGVHPGCDTLAPSSGRTAHS
jgi:hypothetical protein